ncbi:hypothetical protein ABSA28_00397 [Candidatus Hepatincolaceae symbiont of Richtersius coronifer]
MPEKKIIITQQQVEKSQQLLEKSLINGLEKVLENNLKEVPLTVEANDSLKIIAKEGYKAGNTTEVKNIQESSLGQAGENSLQITTAALKSIVLLNSSDLHTHGEPTQFFATKLNDSLEIKGVTQDFSEVMPSSKDNNFTVLTNYANKEIDPHVYETSWESDFLTFKKVEAENFLEGALEERLLYYLNKTDDGAIYKILKNSFINNNEHEVWGYELGQDKIDLAEFVDEYGSLASYHLSKNEGNLQLHIESDRDYSIIFKEVDFDKTQGDLDDILQNMVINPLIIKC